ncbi:hypothetical protein RRG08_042954 [Elysia crispata]|uniref:C1q domain-containing protein n=1 Tax=Elysia crispata TaxID=231223 RepID=A0AAE1E724_9GAST|nr:hypothetical protein RRG08_042954 [Elysia crispata]
MAAFMKLFEKRQGEIRRTEYEAESVKADRTIDPEFLRSKPDQFKKSKLNSEKNFLSQLERIEKLEQLCASLETSYNQLSLSKEQERQHFESRINNLEKITSKLKINMSEVQKSTSDSPQIEHKLRSMTMDVQECRKDSNKMKESIKSLQTLAVDSASLGVQIKKMKSKHKAMEQKMIDLKVEKDTASLVIAKKVANLERLRNMLNQDQSEARATGRGLRQMQEGTQQDLQALSTDVENLRSYILCRKMPPVGFTVQLHEDRDIRENWELRKLFKVVNNSGNCFRPYKGHFVVPYDGLYCFCIKLEQNVHQDFTASLMVKSVNGKAEGKYEIPMRFNTPHSALCTLEVGENLVQQSLARPTTGVCVCVFCLWVAGLVGPTPAILPPSAQPMHGREN